MSVFIPSRAAALGALERVRETPVTSWTSPAVFGYYIERYEARYYRKWAFTKEQTKKDFLDFQGLVARVGVEEAVQAIRITLTSGVFRWVNNTAAFLTNRDSYERHIVPAITAAKGGREPGQYTGDREGEVEDIGEEFWRK